MTKAWQESNLTTLSSKCTMPCGSLNIVGFRPPNGVNHDSSSLVSYRSPSWCSRELPSRRLLRQVRCTPYRFSTSVDLVMLNIAVRDRKGWFVPDLIQPISMFRRRRSADDHFFRHEDMPVAVGLVVDHSGSMAPKLSEVIAAARTFVASSRADDACLWSTSMTTVTLENSNESARSTSR